MTTLELPNTELMDVDLLPTQRRTLGAREVLESQRGRLAVGWPTLIPLDTATLDESGRAYLAGRPDSNFFLLNLNASFALDTNNPLESAWVEIVLSADAPAVAPVAWSMTPLSAEDSAKQTKTVTLDATLKFKAFGIEAGPSAKSERTTTSTKKEVSLEALFEGTSKPTWRLYATPSTAIHGLHRLSLVVDSQAGSAGSARVGIGATIRLKRLKVFRYSADLRDDNNGAVVAIPAG